MNLLFPKIKDGTFHEITSLNIQCSTILKVQTSEASTAWFVWLFCCLLKLCCVFCLKVEAELRAQVNRFCELVGHMPYHMDGHQHVHILPGNSGFVLNNPFHREFTYTTVQKFWVYTNKKNSFWNELPRQRLFNQNVVNIIFIYLYIYIFKCSLFLWSNLNVQHHYSSLDCHMIL